MTMALPKDISRLTPSELVDAGAALQASIDRVQRDLTRVQARLLEVAPSVGEAQDDGSSVVHGRTANAIIPPSPPMFRVSSEVGVDSLMQMCGSYFHQVFWVRPTVLLQEDADLLIPSLPAPIKAAVLSVLEGVDGGTLITFHPLRRR